MSWPTVRMTSKILLRAQRYQKSSLEPSSSVIYQNWMEKNFHTSSVSLKVNKLIKKELPIHSVDNTRFKNLPSVFDTVRNEKNKRRDTFLDVLHMWANEPDRKTGHIQFIYSALRYMDEFGLNEDLEVYRNILDIMPKGRFVCRSLLQAEFMHHPREQQCAIDLLQKMEDNGVIPDPEFEIMLINMFGEQSIPLRKLRRMAYWMGKFKNLNPWPFPKPLPTDALELAKIAISKIASVDVQSQITVFDTETIKESIDKTWIVSASSPDQERLISQHPKDVAIYVEGPYRIWIYNASVDYFILRSDIANTFTGEDIDEDDITNIEVNFWKDRNKELAIRRCIHEQDTQTIFGVCATGKSTKDSLLSWIRCLQTRNPDLEKIPILFKFTRQVDEFIKIEDSNSPDSVPGKKPEEITS